MLLVLSSLAWSGVLRACSSSSAHRCPGSLLSFFRYSFHLSIYFDLGDHGAMRVLERMSGSCLLESMTLCCAFALQFLQDDVIGNMGLKSERSLASNHINQSRRLVSMYPMAQSRLFCRSLFCPVSCSGVGIVIMSSDKASNLHIPAPSRSSQSTCHYYTSALPHQKSHLTPGRYNRSAVTGWLPR